MDKETLSHTRANCKYHSVFTPKYRRQVIYGQLRKDIGEILRTLCERKGVTIIEAAACKDHIHMYVEIPPKYSVAEVMGYLKGKSSLMIFDRHANLKYKYGNRHFWCKGYYVDTVGRNEKKIAETKAFVLGFPGADQVREADYIGVKSGYNADKLKDVGFTVSEARTVHAPVINELRLSLECEVVHTVTVGSHTQITGEVKNILAEESILNENGRVLLDRLDPLIYDEEQGQYLHLGDKVADAFRLGMDDTRSRFVMSLRLQGCDIAGRRSDSGK